MCLTLDAMVDASRAQLDSHEEIHLGWCLLFERGRLYFHIFSLEISATQSSIKVHFKIKYMLCTVEMCSIDLTKCVESNYPNQ